MHKILIVDDQADIRRMMHIALGEDFNLLEAEDGSTALDMVRQHKPDVVLLDVMMPGGLDGLQVLDQIRADVRLKHTRVILVSAKGQVSDYELGMQRGANAYFVKPFSPLQLLAAINDQLTQLKEQNE
jgi:DNA-binding response OmpR family regulator